MKREASEEIENGGGGQGGAKNQAQLSEIQHFNPFAICHLQSSSAG